MRGYTPALGEPGGQLRCRELRPGELDSMETNIHVYDKLGNKSYVAASHSQGSPQYLGKHNGRRGLTFLILMMMT